MEQRLVQSLGMTVNTGSENPIGTVLVVDDDAEHRRLLQRWLETAGHHVEVHDDGDGCLAALARTLPDVVLLDLHMPRVDGLEILPEIVARNPRLPVVMVTSDTGVAQVVNAMQAGAFDYLSKPVSREKLTSVVRHAIANGRMREQVAQLDRLTKTSAFPGIIGRAPAMQRLFREMERVAASDITVLIQGESGTGKELVSSAIHTHSGRNKGPFIALNCAAIPESLQESELFGHERGAFTGATSRRAGRFEQADKGTLFLDEVGELSPGLQAKLLRVVQERRFHRVGGDQELRTDVRLVAATHRDLEAEVEAGRFREDLYYRLAVFELDVPPLRERSSDIPALAQQFVQHFSTKYGNGRLKLSGAAMACLQSHPWPGNVRQLQNAIERGVVIARDGVIQLEDLPKRLQKTSEVVAAGVAPVSESVPDLTRGMEMALVDIERAAIVAALERHDGNVTEVSRSLGIPRTTLYRKLRKHGIRAFGA
ncbi:MAG: DNA-binding NtrC family response regulator [Myxococcota bacterium]|jgi:DNA-binding NtrC family response regulator